MKKTLLEKSKNEIIALSPELRALWHAANNDWNGAHEIVQDETSPACASVHAFLHRVEGDFANARYWYSRAGRKPVTDITPHEELRRLIEELESSQG